MFETLRQTHGAAILKDVQRVKEADQKAAFGKMHEGEFLGALQTFEKAGGIHWTEKQTDALRDMAVKYTADLAATPDKRRFMFAFTNAEVDALNGYARILHQRRGDLGADHELATASGAKKFATGDRIQFTGNGYTQSEKNAGFTNGRVGTITEIDTTGPKPCVTVELDTAKGREPQSVSFIVGDGRRGGRVQPLQAWLRRNDLSRAGAHARPVLCLPFGAMEKQRRLCRLDAAPRERPHLRRPRDGQRPRRHGAGHGPQGE